MFKPMLCYSLLGISKGAYKYFSNLVGAFNIHQPVGNAIANSVPMTG